ncbi:uncharacterized protein YbjT (DUF2867 family) [Scopulibacillus darangshiensis]|uniref:Uncharacterized protein YbjT (DUF2867 family) n=1 Tax=Scopulibacillus darangshiensis TaxID=442528 RepID=A0A4R2P2H2_9BACL|nr:SDR family oxidoreductase [Scopulibacillus darangshiensis]TCP28913.1 uncharacterized protein YbjT (DUF2867 family) [Scopulibacillus darangshiensis]
MNILIVGSHGKIGKQVVQLLSKSNHHPKAMIRNEEQRNELEKLGGEVVIADLEKDFGHALKGVDAIVFTAGSGGHTGPEKTELVDRQGAMKIIEAAEKEGISRFIMVSSMNADTPENGPESMRHYYKAKGDADDKLRSSNLIYTIIRPGKLLDDPGKGKINAAGKIEGDRSVGIPRADVAAIIVTALDMDNTYKKTFEVLSGEQRIEAALKSL